MTVRLEKICGVGEIEKLMHLDNYFGHAMICNLQINKPINQYLNVENYNSFFKIKSTVVLHMQTAMQSECALNANDALS